MAAILELDSFPGLYEDVFTVEVNWYLSACTSFLWRESREIYRIYFGFKKVNLKNFDLVALLRCGVAADVFHYIAMSESSKPIGIMPNHLDLREITFTNLLLLDFNPAEMESKYRVVFNR